MPDMSLMAKLVVQGPARGRGAQLLSANDVTSRASAGSSHTQWLNEAGGIIADVTVTWLDAEKFLVVASDIIHRRIEPLISGRLRPGEIVTVTDVTSGTTPADGAGPGGTRA